jgi:hypothetical protein
MSDRSFDYSIDRNDAIASVSDAWLEFARENRASELTRDFVLGQPLWRFIAGRETRLLYEELFRKVRTGAQSIELPFRCDSPDRFRFMRLDLRPGQRDAIDCRGILIREQERPFFSLLDRLFPRRKGTLSMCSLCKRLFVFDTQWLELEDAIRKLDLLESAALPEIQYAVCR